MIKAQDIITELGQRRRLLVLGGLAVIFHGLSRTTEDVDLWLDPEPPEAWAEAILAVMADHPTLSLKRIGSNGWEQFSSRDLAAVGPAHGVVRLEGCDDAVDIFFAPNEVETKEFAAMWRRAKESPEGVRFLEEIDLLLTKQATGRNKDFPDIAFLEGKIDEDYGRRLRVASLEEATKLLERYATPGLLREVALNAGDEEVRALARRMLAGLYADGDPFAAEYLRELGG